MNNGVSQQKCTKEMDLFDMFWEWVSHWRSFLVTVFVSAIVALLLILSFDGDNSDISVIGEGENQETKDLFADMPEYTREYVDELVTIRNEYLLLNQEYELIKGEMPLVEKTETVRDLANIKNNIESMKKNMSEDQKYYYYHLIGLEEWQKETTSSRSKKPIVLSIAAVMMAHIIICSILYIIDTKIKYTDSLSDSLCCPELSKCIDWSAIDRKKGIDKLVLKARLTNERRMEKCDVIKNNANSIVKMANNAGVKSVVIISIDKDEANLIKNAVNSIDASISVNCVESLVYDVEGALMVNDVEAAVLLAKVGVSKINELFLEKRAMNNHGIEFLAAVSYI